MGRNGFRSVLILVLLSLRVTTGQDPCGSKYLCGDGTECVFFYCVCNESSETDPWEIREGERIDGRQTLYCRKMCNVDSPVCPDNKLCTPNPFNQAFCECPPGFVLSRFGHCVDPNATSSVPTSTRKHSTSVTQRATAATATTTTRVPTTTVTQSATAATTSATTSVPTASFTQTATVTSDTSTTLPGTSVIQTATATTGTTTNRNPTTSLSQTTTATTVTTATTTTTTRISTTSAIERITATSGKVTTRSSASQSSLRTISQPGTVIGDLNVTTPLANVTKFNANSTEQPVTQIPVNSTEQTVESATGVEQETAPYVYVLAGVGGACALLLLLMGIALASWQAEKRKYRRTQRAATSLTVGQSGSKTNGLRGRPTLFDYSSPFPARQMQENATISGNLDSLFSQVDNGRTGVNTERLRKEGYENRGYLSSEDSGAGSISTAFVSNRGGDGALREEGNIVINNMYSRRIEPVRGNNPRRDDEEQLLPESGIAGRSEHMYDNTPTGVARRLSSGSDSDVFEYPPGNVTRF